MVSWLEELERRDAAARDRIAELRGQIKELTVLLVVQEEVASRLGITRETMSEILSGDSTVTGPEAGGSDEVEPAAGPVTGAGSPVGVRLVPTWSAEVDAEVLPPSYRDIVEILGDAVHPMRAHQLCSVLGLSTDKSKVEGFRSKLKRLAERDWIAEVEPGLFASRDTAPRGRAPGRGNDPAVSPRAGE
ncbi:helix-turn-helix transcriptional regulator [Streptomyces sp. NBC_01304]|uniref:helix-turn-helix transcriptional regulator n=1 Tax=Streptomyces sp. NBC_01304 TaxID=2903818 RepID=UPI002E11DE16|nr:helix-turn-helix domain-containing protein [Streptomyces sp. NBC_01304]WSJ82408.1 helix-turn-helix domain-containing protein [Streptomyces sp. NBC_01304]WSJ84762.1 helix-turn-helix domain-containing protein [Streptomyces sp. NBC_01304]